MNMLVSRLVLLIALAATGVAPAGAADLEWSGVCTLAAGDYVLTVAAPCRDAAWQTPPMVHLVVLPLRCDERPHLRSGRTAAQRLFETEPVLAPGGKGIILVPGDAHFELRLDPGRSSTSYALHVTEAGPFLLAFAMTPWLDVARDVVLTGPTGHRVTCH